jgi:hypothetical protein
MSLVASFERVLQGLGGFCKDDLDGAGLEFLKELEGADIDIDKLACLEAGGVDNWDFYHDSLRDNNWIGLEDDEEEEE